LYGVSSGERVTIFRLIVRYSEFLAATIKAHRISYEESLALWDDTLDEKLRGSLENVQNKHGK
jgi:hypothetical protein